MTGDRTDEPLVRDCLVRQAAAIYIHPLDDGDYATVRYDYEISL